MSLLSTTFICATQHDQSAKFLNYKVLHARRKDVLYCSCSGKNDRKTSKINTATNRDYYAPHAKKTHSTVGSVLGHIFLAQIDIFGEDQNRVYVARKTTCRSY